MNSFILRFQASSFAVHPLLVTFASALLTLFFLPNGLQHGFTQAKPPAITTSETDRALQQAAVLALGEREGTIIVMDPQTGRIRAIVNPRVAAEEAMAPGSTIKPFATLAALRAGLLSNDSRLLCRDRYRRDKFEITCSHPKEQPPFSASQALAFSCNYFFGELSERLSEEAFGRTLIPFGFGARTGFAEIESAGHVPRGSRVVSDTLGEEGSLKATPIQLIAAYAALVNGGHLYTPKHSPPYDFTPIERDRLEIDPSHRQIIVDGMRGAVKYGSAEKADLHSLPLNIHGKTGTSTANDSARTQGWFVGFTSDQLVSKEASPTSINLVVLVFLRRAHGADSAAMSRVIFDEFARSGSRGDTETSGRVEGEQHDASARLANLTIPVRIRVGREKVTRTMTLEDYILGVVAAEGSVDGELESLKALAVASRTYAIKNLHRHQTDDYDFCTLTHCQRYWAIAREGAREAVSQAVDQTAGEILNDRNNQVVESYFSASCGGMTADVKSLWGVAPKSYLRGIRDDNCRDAPNSSWIDVIPATKLAAALASDPRSSVGKEIKDVRVVKQDATGRAELIELTGERRRTIRGWDFKIIVGRALGWNLLKSSRFTVSRQGLDFAFQGSGFGHGLGLCQEGAHVMAANGIGYRHILSRYFPGTTLKKQGFDSSTAGT